MSDDQSQDREDAQGRRGFLTRSSALIAALGATSVGGAANAQGDEMSKLVAQVFEQAMRTGGDVDGALRKAGKIPPEVERTLRSLSKEDWAMAARLNEKLQPLARRLDVAADNNGYIGM